MADALILAETSSVNTDRTADESDDDNESVSGTLLRDGALGDWGFVAEESPVAVDTDQLLRLRQRDEIRRWLAEYGADARGTSTATWG